MLHSHKQHGSVNAVAEETEDTPIAAIQPARGKGRSGRGQRSHGRGGSGRGGRGGYRLHLPSPGGGQSPPLGQGVVWLVRVPLALRRQGQELRPALQLGKLKLRGCLNAVTPGPLVHIVDQLSNRHFLIDTGASYSVFNHQSSALASGPRLIGQTGRPIPCWGERWLRLSFHGQIFTWTFLLAAVQFPIIGVDFLRHFRLLVDPAADQLVASIPSQGRKSFPTVAGIATISPGGGTSPASAPVASQAATCGQRPSSSVVPPASASIASQAANCGQRPNSSVVPPALASIASQAATRGQEPVGNGGDSFTAVVDQFPEVVNVSQRLPKTWHGVVHHLVTTGPPVSSKFRRLDSEKLAVAKAEFAQLERDGIIRRSSSPWASPLHMVRKEDGGWRPCGDFCRLNLVTVPDSYPLLNMLDFTSRVAWCRFFSKVDLRMGYHQIPMNDADIPKTGDYNPFQTF
jgi:hypothetical protein